MEFFIGLPKLLSVAAVVAKLVGVFFFHDYVQE